jgi:flavin reductase (DIM6/NTAB) family NADH-FMN oxidoreductase RutF
MPEPVEAETFRSAMREIAAPVVVVTAAGGGEARGITIGSFTSVALEPPLVSFNVGHEASMHAVMEACDRFCVHFLGERQASLADHFATPGLTPDEQFDPIPHRIGEGGVPVVDGVPTLLHCTPYKSMEAGDHTIYVGQVVGVESRADGAEAGFLETTGPTSVLYYRSTYHGVGGELESTPASLVNRSSSGSS